jgi:acetylornithine/succinyldiaminopimelate/putrescine aminotransferase
MGSIPVTAIMENRAANSATALAAEKDFSALNYLSLPIVFARALGAEVWDPEGKRYLDFHSASTALNHGHCHPKLVAAMIDQLQRLTLTSRAFHNDVYPMFAELVTKTFGYQRVLPSTTGAEAGETAIKVARKWAYKVKGVPVDQAIVLGAAGNHHGRTVCVPWIASAQMQLSKLTRMVDRHYIPSIRRDVTVQLRPSGPQHQLLNPRDQGTDRVQRQDDAQKSVQGRRV